MATLAELIQPFFQARLQGKEAVRKASDSLNMDKFEREVQAIREKKEEDRRKREGNLKIGLDLTQAGYDPKMAFGGDWYGNPQGLATLPNLNPSADKFLSAYGGNMSDLDRAAANSGLDLKTIYATISKRLQDEADNAARLQAVQARVARGGGSSALKKFELDTIAQARGSVNPALQAIIENLGKARAHETTYKNTIDALKKNPLSIDMDAVKQYTDSLSGVNNQISTLRGDSTNIMNLIRADALGQLPQTDFTDQELEDFWLNQ